MSLGDQEILPELSGAGGHYCGCRIKLLRSDQQPSVTEYRPYVLG